MHAAYSSRSAYSGTVRPIIVVSYYLTSPSLSVKILKPSGEEVVTRMCLFYHQVRQCAIELASIVVNRQQACLTAQPVPYKPANNDGSTPQIYMRPMFQSNGNKGLDTPFFKTTERCAP